MVNMKVILLVSLAVVFAEAIPFKFKENTSRQKRGIFDNFWGSVQGAVDEAASAVQEHLGNAREHILNSHEETRARLNELGETMRGHAETLGEKLRGHADRLREHVDSLADRLNEGNDDDEQDSAPVIDLA